MKTITDSEGYEWFYCTLCKRPAMLCPKCGNNCCNGGYGQIEGKKCDKCPDSYDHQDKYFFKPTLKDFE